MKTVLPFIHLCQADSTTKAARAQLHLDTEIKNYARQVGSVTLVSRLVDKRGRQAFE